MRPRQLTALLTFGAAVTLALVLGISIATANYALLIFAATLILVVALVLMPGYIPLFIFGLLMPFSLPIPYIWNCPFLLIAMGICALKYWLQRGLLQRGLQRDRLSSNFKAVDFSIGLFFTWVFVRYCMKPALPNVLGFGTNVTGFRSWLNYGLSFCVLLFVGRFIGNRVGVLKLMRWMGYVSIFFILILVPVTLSRSPVVGYVFMYLGMYVSTFDSGNLRFVTLPAFGLFLLSLLLLPSLFKVSRAGWGVIFALAMVAIVLGGNRSSLGMAFIIVTVIPLLRHKYLQTAIIVGIAAVISVAAYVKGPALSQLPNTGFLRVFGLVSPALAESSGAAGTLEWREIRWQRAMEEIRKHPFIGEAYGGLENAFESVDPTQSEEASQDISLATGGVHNGYIASALALGIPAAALFVYIIIRHVFLNARRAIRLQKQDPVVGEAHCFVCANLLSYAATIFIGSDLNDPMIWFFFAMSLFLLQLRSREFQRSKAAPVFAQPILAGQMA